MKFLSRSIIIFANVLCLAHVQAAPQWTMNPSLVGSVDEKQTLVRAYPLGPTVAAPEFALSLQLLITTQSTKVKRGERDARILYLRKLAQLPVPPVTPKVKPKPGEPDPDDARVLLWQTQMVIPQLTSFIYPANRDRFIWNPPGGGEIIFKREDIEGDYPQFTPEGWACEEVKAGIYRIFDRDGWSWRYENGLPVTLTAPSGRYLDFTHDANGLLTRVVQHLSAGEQAMQQVVLQVKYDAKRRPVQIDSGPVENRFTYDDRTGHMLAWHSTMFKLGDAPAQAAKPDATRPESDPAIAIAPGDERQTADTGAVMGALRFAYLNDVLFATQTPFGKVERFTWDYAHGRLLTDGTYRYSGGGDGDSGITATDAEGRRFSIGFNATHDALIRTAPDRTTTMETYRRNAAGQGLLGSKNGPNGEVLMKIDYTPRHLVSAVRELGKPEIRNVYDNRDRLVEVWRAPLASLDVAAAPVAGKAQLVESIAYDGPSRQPSAVTNALGQTTRFAYDARGQLIAKVSPSGATERYAYDTWGRVVRHDLPNGSIEQIKYDASGRVVEKLAADGTKSTFAYDGQGRVTARTENSIAYTYRYDDQGRQSEVQRAGKPWLRWRYSNEYLTLSQPTQAPAGWPAGVKAVNASVVTFVDPRGNETKKYFDEDGRVMEGVDANGDHTSYRYNQDGEVVGWVDARGNALVFQRDVMGRLVKQQNALGQVLGWQFDSAGRLAERDNGVQAARYNYDAAGRLTGIDYGNGQVVTYQRDDFGRMLSASTGDVSTLYTYDALDRVVRTEQHPTRGEASGMACVYDIDGRKTVSALLAPDSAGRLVEKSKTLTTYDALNRVVTVSLDGTETLRNTYDPSTLRLAAKHLGNGQSYSYAYDDAGHMTRLDLMDRTGTLRERLTYDWNPVTGLLDRKTLATPSAAPAGMDTVELRYGYDKLGRLAAVSCPQDAKANRAYRYDGAGNLVESQSGDRHSAMNYDAANQLTTRTEQGGGAPETDSFTYDFAGRMLTETDNGALARRFTYGYLDKVLSVDRPDNRRADYVYDAGGMLVRKGVSDPAAGAAPAGGASPEAWQSWVWDGLALARRGDEVFVNEAHPAGGEVIMSRTLTDGAPPNAAPQSQP